MTMIFWSFGFLRMGTVGLGCPSLGKGDYREIVLITLRNLSYYCFFIYLYFNEIYFILLFFNLIANRLD